MGVSETVAGEVKEVIESGELSHLNYVSVSNFRNMDYLGEHPSSIGEALALIEKRTDLLEEYKNTTSRAVYRVNRGDGGD